ncbi:hypothetical protein EJ06DRAFT_582523 [Trichodelitschia bisporula]|uniref:Anaphase-promoting complex subunit 2 n=1 Tax=Trichodelitschia bisporula TaxID=703511 RepID=A0A6G1HVG6_9PEZI|nr:hypothetical protein EJ06DRAFT_582523 [Trichodelitschia bisporula]
MGEHVRNMEQTIFQSVFPPSFELRPSPESIGSPSAQAEYMDAWSTATRFLELGDISLGAVESLGYAARWNSDRFPDFEAALQTLTSHGLGSNQDEGNLIEWYCFEVKRHFVTVIRPILESEWQLNVPCGEAFTVLKRTVTILTAAKDLYMYPLLIHVFPIMDTYMSTNDARQKVENRLHAIFSHHLPTKRIYDALGFVMYSTGCEVFRTFRDHGQPLLSDYDPVRNESFQHMSELVHGLREVGLAGRGAQVAFARAMDKLMGEFVIGQWVESDPYGQRHMTPALIRWIEGAFPTFMKQVLVNMADGSNIVSETDQEIVKWHEMAVARLGKARVKSLFDFITHLDVSTGGLMDIKDYIATPATRSQLTASFSQQLSTRLLHAGTATTRILDVYIYIVRAFKVLDPKGVLLDRITRPVRRYVRDRNDAARVIIWSLLAEVNHGAPLESTPTMSSEIAREINSLELETVAIAPVEDVDWDNMTWMPDPIDATPDYKKPASEDVIMHLLGLCEREVFIDEVKSILGEHLLRVEGGQFINETRLLKLFTARFGADKLQACEVMLKDMETSRKLTWPIVRTEAYRAASRSTPGRPRFKTHIVSSFFWPQLLQEVFDIPQPVDRLCKGFEQGFKKVKPNRRLKWLPALGRVTVELELKDRRVEEEVPTWNATVINAFGSTNSTAPVSYTVEQLAEDLSMKPFFVRAALTFWAAKNVLYERNGTFTVIESLNDYGNLGPSQPVQSVQPAEPEEEKPNVDTPVHRQMILAMLTNHGGLPIERIHMMLKVVLPTFTFDADELGHLLVTMIGDEILVNQGGLFSLKR